MAVDRISQHSPSEDPENVGEVTPIRSSEGKIIIEKIKYLVESVMELQQDQGKLVREVSKNAAKTELLTEEVVLLRKAVEQIPDLKSRVDSMRPKMDSVPQFIDEKITEHERTVELTGYRQNNEFKKTLKLEVYKVVIGVVLAAALGIAANVGWNALIYAAGHQRPAVIHTQP
jgi:hypothetical protein